MSDLPPFPTITGLDWRPESATSPTVQGSSARRLRMYANSDIHSYEEMVDDTPGGDDARAGQVQKYWDGGAAANYVLTLRSYWQLVPGSYATVGHGDGFTKEYTVTEGISTTDAQSLAASLGVAVEGISASISTAFSHSVTTSSETTDTTTHTVQQPTEGMLRVWMLWQLIDELVAIDPGTNDIVANPNRHADVNWSEHEPGGAWVQYQNLHQHFPSTLCREQFRDLPAN